MFFVRDVLEMLGGFDNKFASFKAMQPSIKFLIYTICQCKKLEVSIFMWAWSSKLSTCGIPSLVLPKDNSVWKSI